MFLYSCVLSDLYLVFILKPVGVKCRGIKEWEREKNRKIVEKKHTKCAGKTDNRIQTSITTAMECSRAIRSDPNSYHYVNHSSWVQAKNGKKRSFNWLFSFILDHQRFFSSEQHAAMNAFYSQFDGAYWIKIGFSFARQNNPKEIRP